MAFPGGQGRRALLITQTSVIGLYLLFSYAATVGWGLAKMAGFSAAPAPLLTLTHTVAGPVGEAVVTVLVLNSVIGVNLAVNIAMGRMLLDQARMGAVPRRLARIHPVHHTPVTALTVTVIVQLAVAYTAGAAWGLIDGFIVCIVGIDVVGRHKMTCIGSDPKVEVVARLAGDLPSSDARQD